MKLSRRALLAASGALIVPPAIARADDTDVLLARVAKARASLKTLRGPFTQSRKIGLLATEVKSSGTLMLVRPDRLRWELGPPDDVVYWVVPEGLAYKSKSGQGRVRGESTRVAAALGDLRALLGGDLASLRKRYDLVGATQADGSVVFEATPKMKGSGLLKIEFALAPDLVRPTRATLVESEKDRVVIAFGNLERDVPIDPSLMKPPS
jgi:outer membrane lipoprotein-sorting protein